MANDLLKNLLEAFIIKLKNEPRLNPAAVIHFGSTARGPFKHETDIDLMIVCSQLPQNRYERFELIYPLEQSMDLYFSKLRQQNHHLYFSTILKTKEEFAHFSLLYLDMITDAKILLDEEGLAENVFQKTKQWIEVSGAYRVQRGLKWYWVLKKDYKQGEYFQVGF